MFERQSAGERILVAINGDENEFFAGFDAGAGSAVDLLSGKRQEFRGGALLPGYSAAYWKVEA